MKRFSQIMNEVTLRRVHDTLKKTKDQTPFSSSFPSLGCKNSNLTCHSSGYVTDSDRLWGIYYYLLDGGIRESGLFGW